MYRYLRGTESPRKPFPYALEYAVLKTTANFTMIDKANGHAEEIKNSSPSFIDAMSGGTGSAVASGGETQSTGSADDASGGVGSGCLKETTNRGRGFKRPAGSKRATAANEHVK